MFSIRTALVLLATVASTTATATDFCADKADGLYAHPEDCAQFISCAADGLIEASMDCPAGLLWNDSGKYCDWDFNVTCPEPVSELEPLPASGWVEEASCNAFGGDLHFIHGYMEDRDASIAACESVCVDSDFDCCQVDNDNFCYGAYTTQTVFNPAHSAVLTSDLD